MIRCTRCEGFIPGDLRSCPNCAKGAPRGRATSGVLGFLSAGAAAITLMACYGAPPCDPATTKCVTPPDPDAGMTVDGGADAGATPDAGACDGRVDGGADAGATPDAGACDGGGADGGC